MLSTMAGIYAAAASGLGGYNIVRFLSIRAIKKRRERKKQAHRDAVMRAIFDKAEGAYKRLNLGDLDESTLEDIVALVKTKLNK